MLSIPGEIKGLLHLDNCNKNIRIHFPNGERSDICNDQIVLNSVKFTESLCSQNSLKFGLCESPVFECEVVGVSNVKGASIEVYCEVYCEGTVTGAVWRADLEHYVYPIPYGTFTIAEAKRQADILHRKIVAYGTLAIEASKKVNSSNNVGAFLACQGLSQAGSFDTYVEELLWTYYPRYFDKTKYTYTASQLYSSTTTSAFTIYTKTVQGITYEIKVEYLGKGKINSLPAYIEINPKEYVAKDITEDLENAAHAFATHDIITYEEALELFKSKIGEIQFNVRRQDSSTGGVGITREMTITNKTIVPNQGNMKGTLWCWDGARFFLESDGYTETWFPDISIRYFDAYPVYEISSDGMDLHSFSLPLSLINRNGYYFYSAETKVNELDVIALYSALLEMQSLFGRFYRTKDGVEEINIKQLFGLLPENDLYPDSDLYPEGVTGGKLLPQDYQSCWYEDEYTKPYGAVQCQYKNTSNEDCLFTLYLTGYNAETPTDSYQVYELKDNYLIQNSTWTQAQIEVICNAIAANIDGVTYMPVEFVGRGLPYVEAGDTFEILTASNDSITTIVLNRTISGEMVLTDSYKSV